MSSARGAAALAVVGTRGITLRPSMPAGCGTPARASSVFKAKTKATTTTTTTTTTKEKGKKTKTWGKDRVRWRRGRRRKKETRKKTLKHEWD